ncbi:MAG: hypothetical protein ABIJ40_06620 [Bacteroidota bacterium]
MKTKKIYWNGRSVKYTGKSEILYGRKFFEIEMLDGIDKGVLRLTSQCPDCGMRMGQDQPAANPCQTCQIEE